MHFTLKVLAYTARTFLLLALLTAAASICLVAWTMHREGIRLMSVQTGSMAPSFLPGDALLIKRLPASKLHVGDVISYHSPENPAVILSHRLIAIDDGKRLLTTRGDHNQTNDPSFTQTRLMGRVMAVAPGLGTVLDNLKQPLFLAAFLYLPGLAICGFEIKRLSLYYRRRYYRLFA